MSKQREQKAWAVVTNVKRSAFIHCHFAAYAIFRTKRLAKSTVKFPNQRVVPCLITWREES